MKHDEYEIMFRVEDHHWWYVGLRAMLDVHWRTYVLEDDPRVVDVGCGTGATLDALPDGAYSAGIDYSLDAVRFCRLRDVRCTAVASAEALPFPDRHFDAAISCDVLCQRSVRDKSVPLREIRRVLKPGGILLLNLPAYQWLHSSHDTRVCTDRRFTKTEVNQLLRDCSFEPLRATYWNTLLFPPIALLRLWWKLRPRPQSDLAGAWESPLAPLFKGLLYVERTLMKLGPLPFGLSVFVVARKRG